MRATITLVFLSTCVAISGTTCINPWPPDEKKVAATLSKFTSAEELRAYLAKQAWASVQPPSSDDYFFSDFFTMDMAPAPSAEWAETTGTEAEGNGERTDYSTTNIQEIGVDESDIVKNDGRTIYVLEGSTIHIVQATPVESMTELTTVKLESSGDSLYLRNNKLVALSKQQKYYSWYGYADEPSSNTQSTELVGGEWSDGEQTTVTIINVSDPANPSVEATIKFEGDLSSSRLIENKLYLILTTLPQLPSSRTLEDLEAMTLDQWLPDYKLVSSNVSEQTGDIFSWEDCYQPGESSGYGLTMVVTVDIDNPAAEFQKTAISASAGVIYASTKSLYITDTDYNWDTFSSRENTVIHKLSFTENGTDYVASGSVSGRPLNQYSLGEYEGYLRIATSITEFAEWESNRSNSVYVMGESGTSLEVVGSVEDIAPDEQIYAARFLGNRGFLVTFKVIDPLFTMDLSDPTQPKVVGALKVPGYSDHIQLLDENHLLTIGKDAQEAGTFAWVQGVQLSIFDVTDMANPVLMHKEIIGGRGTSSEANYNPKAFNYFAPLNALAFPIDLYAGDTTGAEYGDHDFTGLYVYNVTVENGFNLLGRIASAEGETDDGCYIGYYGFTRGVFIGNNVYSVTEIGAKSALIDDVSTALSEASFANAPGLEKECYFYSPDLFLPWFGEGVQ